MTLGFKIIDKLTNIILNENDKGLIFGVLMDDTINIIKHKMFVGLGIMYYPNLIKLEIKVNDNYITLDDDNCLLFYYENYPNESIIYVTNLFSIINQNEYGNISLEPYYLYTTVIKQDNNILNELFELLVRDFTDLTQENLINVIKMKIVDFSDKNSNVTLFNQTDLDYFNKDIIYFIQALNSELKTTSELYKTEKYMMEFYKKAYDITDYSQFYETNIDKSPLFTYISIVYNIKGYEKHLVSSETNKIIKLDKIFNILELSEKIPFIVYSGDDDSGKKTPKVKIYNKLISDISDTVIKSWVLNEKKKMNQMTYKKIKGLMIKYKLDILKTKKIENLFMTVIINEDGLIIVKLNFIQDDNKTSVEDITEMVKKGVDDIINTINKLDGIYYNSERLMLTKDSKVNINSINVVLNTNTLINKNKFRGMLSKYGISNIFELKESKDETKLSMYYKNFGKRETEDDYDKKGITVTIQNNEFKLNSSIINIYSGYSINQIIAIVNEISIICALIKDQVIKSTSILEEEVEEQKEIKEKSNIKKLKESIKTSSTKCQKQKQPREINESDSKEFIEKNKKSTILYEGKNFICPNKEYPYPGFTTDNILCCFKKEGRRIKQNLENPYILETIVQPSNFIITVSETDAKNIEKKFDTYVIKVISDINEELGFTNVEGDSPYFYISNKSEFPLVHIHNKELINKIEDNENNAPDGTSMWLNPVQLSQLLTKPNKSTCVNQPNLDIKNDSSINAPCKHHSENNIFGYNINAYPCCFDNKRNIYNPIKSKEKNPTKMHILTTDKPAAKQHLGYLQPGLKELFEIINTNKNSKFYRWGVNQNNLAFFNCVLEGIEYKIGNISIENTTELRRVLINYLEKSPEDFNKLSGGNIISKYISLKNYINAIRDNINVIHWVDVIDLMQRALSFNILVIDIPDLDSDSDNKYNYKNTKIVCNLSIKYDNTKPFMIFIKKKKTFEIIVEIEKDPLIIKFALDYDKSNIIKFFLKYYKTSCVKQDVYPDTFNYETSYDIYKIIDLLNGTKHEILCQLVNSFNKVNLIVTKTGLIIPVKETGILDFPFVSFDKFIEKDKLIDIIRYKKELHSINQILPTDKQMKIIGITTKTDDTGKYYTGILTNFGQIIPIKNTKVDDNLQNLETEFPYYSDVDKYISNKENSSNLEVEWNNKINNKKDYIFEIKKHLGKEISENDKNEIMSIIKNTKMSKIKKITKINSIFNEYLKGTEYRDLDFILSHISNEVINDNIQNLLLNNLVTSEIYNPNEVIKRDNESILLNVNDIRKWITKFAIVE
jgi:hypothetical protein